eukprot:1316289-Prymnesium_polylepis.1
MDVCSVSSKPCTQASGTGRHHTAFRAALHRSGAMRGVQHCVLAAVHVKLTCRSNRALHLQAGLLRGQRHQEEYAAKLCCAVRGRRYRRAGSCACHLEVAGTWEDHAALHHVIGHEIEQCASSQRAERNSVVLGRQAVLHERVQSRLPRECLPAEDQHTLLLNREIGLPSTQHH